MSRDLLWQAAIPGENGESLAALLRPLFPYRHR